MAGKSTTRHREILELHFSGGGDYFGHFLVGFLFLGFISIFVFGTYQLDFWKHYFFHDSEKPTSCFASSAITRDATFPHGLVESLPSVPITLPHTNESLLKDLDDSTYGHILYKCNFSTRELRETGITNIHMGWIYADSTTILVNGTSRLVFSGHDKPIIPLTAADLTAPSVLLTVHTSAKNDPLMGLTGKAPIVITGGNKKNSKVSGFEFAYLQNRQLYILLPVLTMGLFLAISWFLGNRSVFLVTAFFYFSLVVLRNMFLFYNEFLPLNREACKILFNLTGGAEKLAILIFAITLLNIGRLKIGLLMVLTIALLHIELLIVFLSDGNKLFFEYLFHDGHRLFQFFISGLLVVSLIERIRKKQIPQGLLSINLVFFSLIAISASLDLFDFICNRFDIPLALGPKVSIVMPLFVGGVVLYTLSLIDKMYQAERRKTERMESDLELAREIQDSLAPPPPHSEFGNMKISCYQLKHSKIAGDWLAVRRSGANEFIMAVVDVTGKGVQAALVVHAIQSLWAEALSSDVFHAEKWIETVNRTLVRLGQHRPHSATMGIVSIVGLKIKYWSLGHPPVYIVSGDGDQQKVDILSARGNVVGLDPELRMTTKEYTIDTSKSFNLLFGTDGVFVKGSMTRPREIKSLLSNVIQNGASSLENCDPADDRTLIHLYKHVAA